MADAHVADVEKTGFLACPAVTVSNTEARVLYGHRVAREWNHLPAIGNVEIEEAGLGESAFRGGIPTGGNRGAVKG